MKAFVGLMLVGVALANKPIKVDFGSEAYQEEIVQGMIKAEQEAQAKRTYGAVPEDESVCFGKFGCYNKNPIGSLPESPEQLQTNYRLYTDRSGNPTHTYDFNLKVGDESEAVKNALKDSSKPLIFVAHGFGGDGNLQWLQKIREFKEKNQNANVIAVDWKRGARVTTLYVKAAANAPVVGNVAAHLAVELSKKYGIPMSRVQFVGFSLGGQMAGFFAKAVYQLTNQKIAKVSALDAAAPLYEQNGIWPLKQYTHFLEAVHTSAGNILLKGKVGLTKNYGHVDYFPNGGIDQPGCGFFSVSCAHNRAVEYYIDALGNLDCLYHGHRCESYEKANKGKCDATKDTSHYMSMKKTTSDNAIFYMKTAKQAPYCIKDY